MSTPRSPGRNFTLGRRARTTPSPATLLGMKALRVLGRSSSHYTRCVRIFAHEFEQAYTFEPMLDLLSCSSADYAGNPAMRLPILIEDQDEWFGTLNICRQLVRRAHRESEVVWPEALSDRLATNALELTLQGMATEVTLIMGTLTASATPSPYDVKNRASLNNIVNWLDENLESVLAQLRSDRRVSFLEVALFCFVTHLGFRDVLDTTAWPRLRTFCQAFAERRSARATEYRFDRAV